MARDDGEWWLRERPVPLGGDDERRSRRGSLASGASTLLVTLLRGSWMHRYGSLDGALRAFAVLLLLMPVLGVAAGPEWSGARRLARHAWQRPPFSTGVPVAAGALYLVGAFATSGVASTAFEVAGGATLLGWLAGDIAVRLSDRVSRAGARQSR